MRRMLSDLREGREIWLSIFGAVSVSSMARIFTLGTLAVASGEEG